MITKKVTVSFMTALPVDASDEQIKEWINFELKNGSISNTNPLYDHDLETDGYISIRITP